MLSWHQTIFFSSFQSDLSPTVGEWAPMESQEQWQSQSAQSEDQSDYSEDQSDQSVDEDGEGKGGKAAFREPTDGTIKSISLLGERSSGTRWIYG